MSQMKAQDLKEVRAIPGNDRCCDCGMKHPQWASVSFGNVFCLECSGVHRSLGVHISFVRSIAMDSWTPAQLKIMKAGGNDACNNYLKARGINVSQKPPAIKQKYDSDAAALYKEVIKARAEGRPEPTQLVKKPPKKNNSFASSGGNSGGSSGGSNDPNGMERLAGESDSQYIARQTRLREEARARMAAKFGNNGGKRTMGGVGSSPHPSSSSNQMFNMDSLTDTVSSGFGTAATGLSSAFTFAKDSVGNDKMGINNVAKDVGNLGMGLWSSLSASAKDVASNLNKNSEGLGVGLNSFMNGGAGGGDGLSALNERARRERSAAGGNNSKYTGFGSDMNMNGFGGQGGNMNGNSHARMNGNGTSSSIKSNGTASMTMASSASSMNQNSAAPLPGESNADYMQRQLRIREAAKAKVITITKPKLKTKPAVAKMKVNKDDDFFASFGA